MPCYVHDIERLESYMSHVTLPDFMGVSWKKIVSVKINEIYNYVCHCRKAEVFLFYYADKCTLRICSEAWRCSFSALRHCCRPKCYHLFSLLRCLCSLEPSFVVILTEEQDDETLHFRLWRSQKFTIETPAPAC